MTIPEILKALEAYTGEFPMEAMKAAIEQREAITPELIRMLEAVAGSPAEWAQREENMLPVLGTYLLAHFREKAAYPLLVKIASAPGEIALDLFGDRVIKRLDRIFALVYDGNPGPLEGLVENEGANEYVRNAAIGAFVVLAHWGRMPREEVVEYFRSLFRERFRRSFSYVWTGLARAVLRLPAEELMGDVWEACQAGLLDLGQRDSEKTERERKARRDGSGKSTRS